MKPTLQTKRAPRLLSRAAATQIALAGAAVGGVALLAHRIDFDEPTPLDLSVRRAARSGAGPRIARGMAPLYPLGLPGGYFTIGYATAHWLHHGGRRGGPAIVTASWLAWLAQRGVKLFYRRERPMAPGKRYRTDSFPSGHTTGITALAVTTAFVLRRQRLISPAAATALAVGAPALMGTYRVLADDHWATDVAGGWMLGGAIGLTCNALLADTVGGAGDEIMAREWKRRRPRRLARRARSWFGA